GLAGRVGGVGCRGAAVGRGRAGGGVVDRGAGPAAPRAGGRPRLELRRQLRPRRLLRRHSPDHVPAHQERLHREQEFAPAPEEADPARTQHLVPGGGDEVAAERLYVDPHVRGRLRRVADVNRAALVRPGRAPSLIVPIAFETRFEATTLTFSKPSSRSRRSSPPSVTGRMRKSAPVRRAMYCHGTKFEWCSSSVTSTTSPGPRLESPQA